MQQARKDWWTLRKLQGESREELVIQIEWKIKRGMDGCDSLMDATAMISCPDSFPSSPQMLVPLY